MPPARPCSTPDFHQPTHIRWGLPSLDVRSYNNNWPNKRVYPHLTASIVLRQLEMSLLELEEFVNFFLHYPLLSIAATTWISRYLNTLFFLIHKFSSSEKLFIIWQLTNTKSVKWNHITYKAKFLKILQ